MAKIKPPCAVRYSIGDEITVTGYMDMIQPAEVTDVWYDTEHEIVKYMVLIGGCDLVVSSYDIIHTGDLESLEAI